MCKTLFPLLWVDWCWHSWSLLPHPCICSPPGTFRSLNRCPLYTLNPLLFIKIKRCIYPQRISQPLKNDDVICSLRAMLLIRDQWFWQNFIISMCDIKFWKGNENLRSVYKKPFFEIFSGFFHFWPFQFSKKFIVPSKRWKLFFFK